MKHQETATRTSISANLFVHCPRRARPDEDEGHGSRYDSHAANHVVPERRFRQASTAQA